ncbi:MAG: hypothetical protein H7645_01975 [Candidatus Heimdallarchaeota archaeon]|nr:hypothetical protein [Candidatus Heimdallarchaeota archaeon]MCK4769086.1 hypothetical protein [Candidatus Heimdallarchaeota archaeon]
MRERSISFSSKWIGIALIVSVIISLLVRSIARAVSFLAVSTGKIEIAQYSRQSNTTLHAMFYLVNMVIVGLLFVYFFFNRNQEKSQKELRIGFTTSVITLGLQLVTIILFIISEVQLYSLLIKPGILKAQLTINISFFVSFIIVIAIYWKIMFSTKQMNTFTKLLSLSLLAFGLCVFVIAMNQIYMLSFFNFPGTGRYVTRIFFTNVFQNFYNVFAVMAGTTIILVTKQKTELI